MDEKFSTLVATGNLKFIKPSLAVLAIASGFFTFKGAALGAETFGEKGMATVFAVASSVAIYTFWNVVTKSAREWETLKDKMLGTSTVIGGMAFIIALSSTYNVAGIDRGAALEHHNHEYIGELSDSLDLGFQDTQFLEGVAAELRQGILRFERLAKDEIENGTISGRPGKGAVSDALFGIAERLRELLSEVQTFQQQAITLSASSRTRLENIRQIQLSSKPLAQRTREIESQSDALRNELARMDSNGLSEAIQRTLSSLHREVDLRANFSADNTIRARQEAALERVRDEIQQTTGTLAGFVTSANADGDQIGIRAFKGISPTKAVLKYWDQILPQWAGGIALDATPFAILIFMLISMGSRPMSTIHIEEVLGTSVRKVMQVKQLEHWLRTGRADPELLKIFDADSFGQMNSNSDGDEE